MSVYKHLLAIAALCHLYAYTALGNVKFEHYGTNTGLTNNSIRWITQDHNGFVWFGTLNGLNRFDGQNIKSYQLFDKNSTNSLNNRIIQIHQDKNNLLWVITYDKKAHVLDLKTEISTSFPYTLYPYEITYKVTNPASYIKETSNGIWLLSAEEGCIRIRIENNTFITKTFNYKGLIQDRDINFVHEDKNRGVWIGTNKGIAYLKDDANNLQNQQFVNLLHSPNISFTSCIELEDEIWFGTIRQGIIRYKFKSNQFVQNEPFLVDSGIVSTISSNANGQILIGTVNSGLYFTDKNKSFIKHFKHKNNLLTKQIKEVYCSKSGKFWFVSQLRGITMFDPETVEFKYYPLKPHFRENSNEPEKMIIFEDSNDNLWIGNYGGGLFRFCKEKEKFEHYYYQDSNPASL